MGYEKEAIPVIYNHHRFDSKGEASTQKLFDDSGIRSTPHPGQFRTGRYGRGGKEIVYSPDFYFCDYGWFGEFKPPGKLDSYNMQQKISAAMEGGASPVANGLAIFGPLDGFVKNEPQKFCLQGEFYQWVGNVIVKRHWILGEDDSGEVVFSLTDINWDDDDNFAHYPQFAKHPSVNIGRSCEGPRASNIVYLATFNAIYAEKNGFFTPIYDEANDEEDDADCLIVPDFGTTEKPFD